MSLLATRLQNWRVSDPRFDKNMSRPCEYGALDLFKEQTDAPNSIVSPRLRDIAFRSIGNDVQIPVLNYNGSVNVATSRSCTIADAENTSALYTIVWQTFQVGFTMVPAAYMNNEIDYDRDFNRKMNDALFALAAKLDESAVAALEAAKTQVFKDLLYYTESGDVVQVPWDMRQEILGDIDPLMRANCYPGLIHIVGNAGVDSMVRKMAQLGLYNEINKRLEFEGKVMHFTNNVDNESGKFGTFYAVVDGNVAVLTRADREALRGASALGHEWGVENLPIINLPVGYHYYTAVGDQSATAGAATTDLTCGVKEYFGFSLDVAFLVAYNNTPTTVANPIIKVEIDKSTAANPVARPVTIVNGEDNPVYTQTVGAGG